MPRSEITIHVSEQNKATTDNVEYSCGACDEQDDSRMVQCDKCDHWFHYDCAGVGEDIVDKDFLCSNCQPSKGARKKRLTNVTRGVSAVTQETALENQVLTGAMPQPSAVTMVSASVTNMPALDLFPPYTMSAPQKATVTRTQIPVTKSRPPSVRLTTNQARCLAVPSGLHSTQMMQPIPTASIPTATSIVVPRETCPAQFTEILQENTQQDPVEPARSCTRVPSSKRSTKQRQLELELQLLDQERALEEQEEKKKREYLRKRYDLLREIANDNNSVASIEEDRSQTRVAEWVQGVTRTNEAQAQPDETRCRQSRDNVDWRFTSAPQQRSQIPPGPIRTTEVDENSVTSEVQPRATIKACAACKGDCYSLEKCQRFKDLEYNAKWAIVKDCGLCRKCLRRHKGACKKEQICGKNGCTYKHHQLLHNDRRTLSDTSGQSFSDPVANAADHDCNLHLKNVHKVLFRVVPVVLYGPKKSLRTYAFLDDGSSLTLIDADVAKELNVEGVPEPLCLKWTGNKRRQENDSIRIDIDISGTGTNRDKHRLHGAHTVSNLDLFRQSLNVQQLTEKYNYLRGIPAESYQAIQPKILIGIDNANLSYPLKGKEGKIHEPIATKTRLGWVIHGGSDEDTVFVGHHSWNLCSCSEKIDNLLNQSVRDYFSLEGLGISKTENIVASTEDKRAIQILQSFTQTNSGHYEARLLWKYDQFRLPNSKPVALQRLRCLESRLKKDPSLSTVIREKLNEYLQKGYIRRLPEEELNEPRKRVWYLPIFPVFNPNKPAKVRIVWDAAAKTKGISLNMMLLKGPDQLTSLISVLLQFRENKVAICGDIREMFHQVFISKDDQDCQRFLWRENPSDKQPSTYIMRVMTFGASCSPSCAQYVKNQNAENHRGQYPAAVNAIIKNHYVDDMLASTETEEEAFLLAQQVHHVHAQAGFEMRNWMSNSTAVVSALQNERTDVKNLNLGSELATEKVLGMWWCTTTDMLMYKLSSKHDVELLSGKRRPTKREVLRTLMAIFDPLGLVSNLLIFLRILMQEIWRTGIQWDEEIPCHLFEKWEHWLEVLPTVSDVCIPRCYRLLTSISPKTVIQLHTFVDASEAGYAAVVYLRFQQGDNVECAIVAAKSRVAPLKYVSIPRLELQAAVIGVRLANTIISSLSFKVDQRHFWTDSRNVLCWIRSDHRKYSPYVAFRVSEILETSNIGDWKYVSSKENVADEATKWSRRPELGSKSRWIKGPVWLWNSNREWPEEPPISDATREELRATVYYHCFIPKLPVDVMEFAKWRRLVRVFATVLRCVGNFRCTITGMKRTYGPLTSQELTQSSNLLIRSAQNDSFSQEIITLSGKQPNLSKSSALYKLNPFLDEHNVIRMQGRISACEYATMDARNPIILPKNHYVSKLIVQDYHERYHHRNHETVVNELRQTFWIPKLRVLFRKVRSHCQICKNLRAAPHPPLMGDLPKARLAAFTRPFSFVGVDYFGPLTVVVGRRIEKRWGVLVTCLTTRAVHLEIAHTLSADSCIMALRNFMARRGKPLKIISDRGTNFTATNKELMAALKMMDQDKVLQEIISPETEWQFLPPSSPHMGGSWERLVQIVKTNLLQINQQRPLTDEILRNLLTEIENLINSRPLTHVPVDNPEAPVLTPNHFILGSSSGLKPASNLNDSALVLRRSWRTSQIEANVFWRRWLRDYMPDLVRRTKWYTAVKPIEVNDIVVVVDPKLPRNCWPKGRIISVRKGNDGQVRAATVQTQNGVYERPATKLAVLDVRRDTKVSRRGGTRVPTGHTGGASDSINHVAIEKSVSN
ncbi:uncharacterized protein LOC128739342 [Sabethes cyaneus]|uniref:uncharacterized protein LOC128739342 n=1 Tax=Sabethes cyaneus TaxID=53552 RepID=UPI00237E0911|nr:uncharacterized protein LOC128739342 [Sabethes cyaneus]